jgi:hypothetical protein
VDESANMLLVQEHHGANSARAVLQIGPHDERIADSQHFSWPKSSYTGAAKDEQRTFCDSEQPDHIYDLAFARIANLGPLAIVVAGDEEPV